jgi:hypothetical protein
MIGARPTVKAVGSVPVLERTTDPYLLLGALLKKEII